jgi:PAS domain-containing protein
MSSPTLHRRPTPARAGRPDATAAPAAPVPRDIPVGSPATSAAARYRYDVRAGVWWWAPEMFDLHGLAPGAVEPCVDLLLQRQHPHDRARVDAALTAAHREGRAFSLQSRLLRPDGTQRTVVLVGEPTLDPTGCVTGVDGLCIDVTDGRGAPDGDRVQELETEVAQLRTAMASRAAIEQAKGLLLLLPNCSDQVAFDLLAHISSHTHRKVREVATAIVESAAGQRGLPDDVRAIIRDACPPSRTS